MPEIVPYLIEIGKAIAVVAVDVAIDYALAEALGLNDRPKPESQKMGHRQPLPPEQRAYGEGRLGGFYAYWTTSNGYTIDVLMQCKGPVQNPALHYYLNDDRVTVVDGVVQQGDDGRYRRGSGATIRLSSRHGATPSPHYAEIVPLSKGQWTAAHRLDGVATVAMLAESVKIEIVQTIYPNGPPLLSSVGQWLKVYDFRKDETVEGGSGAHRRNDPETWEWSQNPVVCWVHDELFEQGTDWSYRFEPAIASFIEAANICDEPIPQYGGGVAPRYTIFLVARSNTPPKDVRQQFLGSFDGLLIERGDGAFVLHAGAYKEPTLVINEDRLRRVRWRKTRRLEDACNNIVLSFLSPDHDYTEVETTSWKDDASIAAIGESSKGLSSQVVTNHSQIRRLGKIAFHRINAEYDGVLEIDLSEDETELEQRFIRVRNQLGPTSMHDVVCEVRGITVDLANRRVMLTVHKVDPLAYAWAGASEEGPPPPPPSGQIRDNVGEPVLVESDVTSGSPRVRMVIVDPARPDYTYAIRWRDTGDDLLSWNVEYPEAAAVSGGLELITGVLPVDARIEYGAAFVTSGGVMGPWADFGTLVTSWTDPAQGALDAYLDQLTVQPSSLQQGRIRTLISALMAAGIWPLLDRILLSAVHTAQAESVDLRRPNLRWTPIGTTTWTEYRGRKGDGATGGLSSGEALSAFTHYSLNSASAGVWVTEGPTSPAGISTGAELGTSAGLSSRIRTFPGSGGTPILQCSGNGPTMNGVVSTSLGLSSFSRADSATMRTFKNGSLLTSGASASSAIGAGDLILLQTNNLQHSEKRLGFAYAGANLTDYQMEVLYTAVRAYMVAVGAP